MWTIGQVAEKFGLSVSTLRYYDAQGFFPELKRTSGIRHFSQTELDILHTVECLKQAGLSIEAIKEFIDLCQEGKSSYSRRLEIFQERAQAVDEEISRKEKTRDMIKYKIWYYQQALVQGNEVGLMEPDDMPAQIRESFLNSKLAD